jgi:hypothetical protein
VTWTGRESNPRTTASLPHLPLRRGCFAELSAIRPIDPGQGIESGVRPVLTGVLPVRRSRKVKKPLPLRPSPVREIDAAGRRRVRGHKAKPCFPCHSPTLRPWITDPRLRVSRAIGVLRGGALEPEPRTFAEKKSKLKLTHINQRSFQARTPRVFLSQAGPRFELEHFKLSITSRSGLGRSPSERKKATRLDRPRLARYPARNLASNAPIESWDVTDIEPLAEAVAAHPGRRGRGRSGGDQ